MRVTTKIVFDCEGKILEHESYLYEGPLELCGPSQSEVEAQQQAQAEAQTMQDDFNKQFGEQQGLLNSFLIPQLEGMINDPQGFGTTALADMNANLVNTTGAQAKNAIQSANQSFDTANMAGLPSGVQQAIKAQINSAAGNNVATGSTQIQLANEQAKQQQQEFGLQGLAGAETALGGAPQTGGLALQANQNDFNQSYQMAQQGNWWQGLLGGAIQAGLGFATGGLSNLTSGLSFLGNTKAPPSSPIGGGSAPFTGIGSGSSVYPGF